MAIKKQMFLSCILLVTYNLIVIPTNQTSSQDFSFGFNKIKLVLQTEFVKKRQLFSEKIISTITFLSVQDAEKINLQELKIQNELKNAQDSEKIELKNCKFHNIVQFPYISTLVLRAALLDRLIQTKRKINIQAHRIKQSVFNLNTPLQAIPTATTDTVFALAAGAAIIEEIVVTGAAVATGIFVGSNHDSKNDSIPRPTAANAQTINAKIPLEGTSNSAPIQADGKNVHSSAKNNSNAAISDGRTKASRLKKTTSCCSEIKSSTPPSKTKTTCSAIANHEAQPACSNAAAFIRHSTPVSYAALENPHQSSIDLDVQKARATQAHSMTDTQEANMKAEGKGGSVSLDGLGVTFTGPAGIVAVVGYGLYELIHARKEFNENHPEYKAIKCLVKETEEDRKSIAKEEKEDFKRILQEAQLSFKKQTKKIKQSNISKPSNSGPKKGSDKDPKKDKEFNIRGGKPKDPKAEAKFLELLKISSKREALVQRFGKFYQDPKTNLWWSQDNAVHGGPHYKVFKETAKGFEWIFDADTVGQKIIDKHKGPVGRFIPYSEIKFLS